MTIHTSLPPRPVPSPGLLGLFLAFLFCQGSILVVPDDHPLIQTAIDSSASGDTVLVKPGTYVENLTIERNLVLLATGTPEETVIDGNRAGSVIWVTTDLHLEGFTIQNGLADDGGGVRAEGTFQEPITLIIKNNLLRNNQAGSPDIGSGGGLFCDNMSAKIERNTFQNNYAGEAGGGALIQSSVGGPTLVLDNIFLENGCHSCGGGLSGGAQLIQGNVFLRNWTNLEGGAMCVSGVSVRNNTVVSNRTTSTMSVSAGMYIPSGSPTIENNLVALNYGPSVNSGIGIACSNLFENGTIILRCNNSWGNTNNYRIQAGCDTTGNISLDPRFCNPDGDDFRLDSSSPSAAENSGCGLVGAFDIGCYLPVRRATWGSIKSRYQP